MRVESPKSEVGRPKKGDVKRTLIEMIDRGMGFYDNTVGRGFHVEMHDRASLQTFFKNQPDLFLHLQ